MRERLPHTILPESSGPAQAVLSRRAVLSGAGAMAVLAASGCSSTGDMSALQLDTMSTGSIRPIRPSISVDKHITSPDVMYAGLTDGGFVLPAVPYQKVKPEFRRQIVVAVLPHPSFVPGTTPRTQPGTDLALLRLGKPLPRDIEPLALGGHLSQGETVTMAGYGLSAENNNRTARRLRETQLVNAGNYTTQNTVKVAVDVDSRGETPGAGACRGDSAGPVLRGSARSRDLVGIVSWSSGPLRTRARSICGGFTAITPVSEYRNWIAAGSARLLALGSEHRSEEAVQPQANASWSWWFTR